MKKILVTGANGHLGYTITKYLTEKDYNNVFAGVRNSADESKTRLLKSLDVNLVNLDITNEDQTRNVAKKVDGIIHLQ
jgi:dihydroflavonol-4-reductase